MDECDVVAKSILCGASASGKSSLVIRLSEDNFFQDISSTVAIDFRCAFIVTRGLRVRLSIFDTAGQERYGSLAGSFIRGANGVILCFDITNRNTFEDLDKWLDRVRMHAIPGTPIMLVGCKCDEEARRQVPREQATAWAQRNGGMPYVETSAKNNTNVQEAFRISAEQIIDRMNAGAISSHQAQPSAHSVKLAAPPSRPGAGPGTQRGGATGGGGSDCGC